MLQVLYHQLGQDDAEESVERQGKQRILRRATMDKNMELSIHNRRLFLGCLAAVEVPGLLALITTIHWAIDYKGGLTYVPNKGIPFNWHPILMTLSLIFLYGNGALIYRIIPPRSEAHKMRLKMAHAGAMMVTFILMVVGLQAAFDSHNLAVPPKPNMYTLHSWVGLLAALLFGCQWALGFAAFLFPKFSPEIRSLLLPFHQYFGSAILALAVGAACMGHLEKMIWSNMKGVSYHSSNQHCLIV